MSRIDLESLEASQKENPKILTVWRCFAEAGNGWLTRGQIQNALKEKLSCEAFKERLALVDDGASAPAHARDDSVYEGCAMSTAHWVCERRSQKSPNVSEYRINPSHPAVRAQKRRTTDEPQEQQQRPSKSPRQSSVSLQSSSSSVSRQSPPAGWRKHLETIGDKLDQEREYLVQQWQFCKRELEDTQKQLQVRRAQSRKTCAPFL
jgi:hypothetical protein